VRDAGASVCALSFCSVLSKSLKPPTGILLWEIVTRQRPYDGLMAPKIIMMVLQGGRLMVPLEGDGECHIALLLVLLPLSLSLSPSSFPAPTPVPLSSVLISTAGPVATCCFQKTTSKGWIV
jgi:hypothetical protein